MPCITCASSLLCHTPLASHLLRLFCVTHHLHHLCFVSFVSHTTCITCASSRSCFTWLYLFLSILLQFSLSSSLSLPPPIAPPSLPQALFLSISTYPPLLLPLNPPRCRYMCQHLCLCLCLCFGTNVEIFITVLWCRLQTWPETCLYATLGVTMCNANDKTRRVRLFMGHESRVMTVLLGTLLWDIKAFMQLDESRCVMPIIRHDVWC